MKAAIVLSIIAIVLLINVAALCAGYERHKPIHNMATIVGGLGLFVFIGLLIAFADAFTQVWVKRPGYEGQPVIWFFYATIATTLGSLATTVTIAARHFGAKG
jgi:hypothetical protein